MLFLYLSKRLVYVILKLFIQIYTTDMKIIYFLKKKAGLKDSYSKDGYVYLKVMDTYSGIDYPNIGGYAPGSL